MPPSPTRRLAGRELVSILMHIIGIFHRTLQCRRAAGSGKGRMGSDYSLSIWEARFVNNKLVCFSASGPWWICLTCLRVTRPKAPPHFPPRLPPSGAGDPISTQIGTSPGLPAGRTSGGCCKALICTLAVASSISQARIKTALYLPGWRAPPPRPREKRNHTHAPSRNSSSNFSACHRWERYSCCRHHRQKRNTHTHTQNTTTLQSLSILSHRRFSYSVSSCHSLREVPVTLFWKQRDDNSSQASGTRGSPGGAVVKNLPANVGDARDTGSIPRWGRSPGGGNGHPLQYSCLGNPMDRGAWWATVQGVTKSRIRLSTHIGIPGTRAMGRHDS